MKSKQKLGFTLIEVMIVIATIVLLASIVLTSMLNARIKARDANRLQNINQLSIALELYYQDNAKYPTQAVAALTVPGLAPTYLATLPIAPTPADTATCQAATTGGINNDYLYSSAAGVTYALTFCLGIGTTVYPAGVHTLTQTGIQ